MTGPSDSTDAEMTTLGERISVVVLTYNHVDVIESTLASVLEQTVEGYEVIVSDDRSTDGTWERICRFAEQHPNVRAIRPPKNLGMAGNANFAARECERPYIALLHHDDLYRENLLERWGKVLDEHADVAFVFNPYGLHESDHVCRDPIPEGRVDGAWLLERFLLPRWGCLIRGTAMVRRSAWEAVGGMREEFGMLADIDLWMRLSAGWAAGYVDEPVITVRRQQPSYYPSEYLDGSWSWRRQRLVYEIHAKNRLERLDRASAKGWFEWQAFRVRLSLETTKWLGYAVVKGRGDMIVDSGAGATDYDVSALRALRWLLQKGVTLMPTEDRSDS